MTEQKVEQTEQDRLERVRSLLSGTTTPDGAEPQAQSAYGNVLMGVFLHGADRLRQGYEPTDLEQLMLDAVGSVLSGEETKSWGRVYREVADSGAVMAVVSQAFAQRPVGEGYSVADLRNDLPDIVAEAMAAGNTQIVDPRGPDRGTDDPAFLEAMRAAKFAVSAFAITGETAGFGSAAAEGAGQAEGAEGPEAGAATTYRAKLEVESFYVRRAVGDRWGGSDEIVWTAAVGTGVGAGGTFRSEEFGDVDKGESRSFAPGNRVLFDGSTSGDYLGASIVCWEIDDTNDEWWAALHEALNKAMNAINFLMDFDNYLGFFPTWVGMATAAGSFLAAFAILFQNKSDISCQRAIGLGRHELAILSRQGRTTWRFDGDGDHDLRVKWTGPTIPFAEGYLEHSIRSGSTWRTGIPLTYKTITTPALAVHEGRLYICFLRPSDQAVMWASTDTAGNWTQPAQIHGDQSYYAPTLTSAGGKLHYAVTGKDSKVYTRTYTPAAGWSGHHTMSGRSKFSPALATYENQAWLVAYGIDENLWHARHNGTWGGWVEDNLDWKLNTHVGLAPRDKRLWRIATGMDQKIYTSINGGGVWVGEGIPSNNWRASHAPALAGNGPSMTLIIRGTDASLWSADYNGSWAGAQKIAGITSVESPAAVYFGGNLHVIYRRTAS
ncbi:hypothetical protein ACFQ7O_03515 [Streptomyces sp. NPDC056485]|uniref:hypothetical protein n=1 Tax=unclassified Streptomyces TaxID=2593676 RepID=UPI0036C8AA62